MKRSILFIIALFYSASIFSQQTVCTPDSTLADSSFILFPLPKTELNPDGGITDKACLNKPFSYNIHFRIPDTVTVSGFTVGLDSIQISPENGLNGLPAGMDFSCTPSDCTFKPDSVISGCVVLFGTPTEMGDFSLTINVQLYTSLGSLPFEFELPSQDSLIPGAQGEYILTVLDENSGDCFIDNTSSTSDLLGQYMSLENVPNPFSEITQIRINSTITDDIEFKVFDLLGRQVHREKISVFEGENNFEFNGSALNEGLYVYTISNEEGMISGRMVLNR